MPPLKIIVTGWVRTLVANTCLILPGFDSQHWKKNQPCKPIVFIILGNMKDIIALKDNINDK